MKSKSLFKKLKEVLSEKCLNVLGQEVGHVSRFRKVTPHRLVTTLISSMAGRRLDSIADVLRDFNHLHDESVAYKAFYEQLAKPSFPKLMKECTTLLLDKLSSSLKLYEFKGALKTLDVTDIVIQDGSSFGLRLGVPPTFGGGTTGHYPQARLHTLLHLASNEVSSVQMTGDKTGEPSCRHRPKQGIGQLYLADRAYASLQAFLDYEESGNFFVIRMPQTYQPKVIAAYERGKRLEFKQPTKLDTFLKKKGYPSCDLEVEFAQKGKRWRGRVVFRKSDKDVHGVRLCTNLPFVTVPPSKVGRIYRLRWQIELLFKEWKSFANVHKFSTKNPHIAEGLIWASLAAAIFTRFIAQKVQAKRQVIISTMKVIKSASAWMRQMMRIFISGKKKEIKRFLKKLEKQIATSAKRSNPKRDKIKGMLANPYIEPVWT